MVYWTTSNSSPHTRGQDTQSANTPFLWNSTTLTKWCFRICIAWGVEEIISKPLLLSCTISCAPQAPLLTTSRSSFAITLPSLHIKDVNMSITFAPIVTRSPTSRRLSCHIKNVFQLQHKDMSKENSKPKLTFFFTSTPNLNTMPATITNITKPCPSPFQP